VKNQKEREKSFTEKIENKRKSIKAVDTKAIDVKAIDIKAADVKVLIGKATEENLNNRIKA